MGIQLAPFCRTLRIKTKNRGVIPLEPNWAQQEIIREREKALDEERPCRIIVLKGRQLGVSTIAEALLFHDVTSEANTNATVVAHDGPSSEHLFNITKHYYDTWEYREFFPHRYSTRRQLTLDSQGSNIWVMTAEHHDAARGRTIMSAHLSELAFWGQPAEAMLALNQAVPALPGSFMMIESTANGVGNFFEDEWISAVSGQTDYVPLFFPWWRHPEYIPCQGVKCLDGSCEACQAATKGLRPSDDEEKDLVRMGCDLAHLAWRRWAIPNKCMSNLDFWHQEYPDTPEMAFIVSGVNAFPETHLKAVFEPMKPGVGRLVVDGRGRIRFQEDPMGPLRMYRQPSPDTDWGSYYVGADPCYGVGGDFAAAQVINRRNHEQVAVWHGRINPIAFGDELAKLGHFYNTATISVEVDGPGIGTIARLQDYPRIWRHRNPERAPGKQVAQNTMSWQTNWKRKQWLVGKLQETIERGAITLHDARTYKELRSYTFYGAGHGDLYGPASKELHDDLVMSLGIAVVCESTEPNLPAYEERASQVLTDLHHVYGEDLRPSEEEEAWG